MPFVNPLVLDAQHRLQHLLGLSREQAERAVAETIDSLRWPLDDYIAARHAELRAQGIPNDEIYERIAAELPTLRFSAPKLSARQIRRRIYG